MNEIFELNLEESMPSAQNALDDLKEEIMVAKRRNYKCLFIIHGYGSSGRGGKIREVVRKYLMALLRNQRIKRVLKGEQFDILSEDGRYFKNHYPQLTKMTSTFNEGITIIEL